VRLTPSSFGSERNLHESNRRHDEGGRFAATGGTLFPGKPRPRATYPDGRFRPRLGDLVFRAPKGGPVEHGHVTTATNGALRVQLVRGVKHMFPCAEHGSGSIVHRACVPQGRLVLGERCLRADV
jgi:hypothetical protein